MNEITEIALCAGCGKSIEWWAVHCVKCAQKAAHLATEPETTKTDVEEGKAHARRMETLKDEAMKLALVQAQAFADGLTESERAEVARHLEGAGRYLLRLSVYLEARSGFGCGDIGHDVAVKTQNGRARRISKALGYSAVSDVTF